VPLELRVAQGALELGQQLRRHDELEPAVDEGPKELGRGARSREESRDVDVGVQNGAHGQRARRRLS
jgi:hypothetical protein